MKGLVVEAAGKICLREDLPLPEIDAYQVLCRNVGCGICNGTDMQLINGQMPFIQYPFVLGHEAVGQVVAVGEKVRSFQEGDYILRSALPGLPGYHSFWGGFAEYGVADDYAARLADHAGADIETSTRQLVPAGIDPVRQPCSSRSGGCQHPAPAAAAAGTECCGGRLRAGRHCYGGAG